MGSDFLINFSNTFGISYRLAIFLLAIIFIWSIIWKLIALWKSARKGSLAWFIVLSLVNTIGILEILYIYVFSELKLKEVQKKSKGKRR
jgi:hypothetical protein